MDATISWDFSNLEWSAVGDPAGLKAEDLEPFWERAQTAHNDLMQRRDTGKLPFYELPQQQQDIDEIVKYAQSVRSKFTDIVVLGIGGSSLGPAALYSALGRQVENVHEMPRFHFPD
ncbi:hypothetical protein KKA08_01110, partial [bacterium]|nr:hypothetical protein [bacterium]